MSCLFGIIYGHFNWDFSSNADKKKFENNVQCLRPRLARQFAKKRSNYKPYNDVNNRQDDYDYYSEYEDSEEINSIGMYVCLWKLDM